MIEENPDFYKIMDKKIENGLKKSANFLKKQIKVKIGIQGPPRSLPGQPPKKDTGDLHESIKVYEDEIKMKKIIIGSDIHYAPDLEIGTLKLLPRPYLRQSFRENEAEILKKFIEGSGLDASISTDYTASDVPLPKKGDI